jgi:hypothetical protein
MVQMVFYSIRSCNKASNTIIFQRTSTKIRQLMPRFQEIDQDTVKFLLQLYNEGGTRDLISKIFK